MNPEFQRNVWMELTPLRLAVLASVLVLVFFAAALSNGAAGPETAARWGYYFLVVIWGTRNAARAVVGEIRDRTWDFQRLSSLNPGTMMWGKLFGTTVFTWTGGFLCLLVILADTINRFGVLQALERAAYYLALGVIAQSASLLASLIAVGRRQGRSQFEVFLYQAAGIAAAVLVWAVADPAGQLFGSIPHMDAILWWGLKIPAQGFLLASLAVFAAWILIGNYRLMRLELKLTNGPAVWLCFLVFLAVYAGGFDAALRTLLPAGDAVSCRIFLSALVAAGLAYANLFLEPKNAVFFRWFGREIGQGRLGSAFFRLPRWMTAYCLALGIGIALVVRLHLTGNGTSETLSAAMLGFLTRDMGIVVLMNMLAPRRGADFTALAVIAVLYVVMPAIFGGLHYQAGQALFLPRAIEPLWLAPVIAWIEAVVVWAVAVVQIVIPERATARL